MRYLGSVYRPPSEAYSLIVQVTYGCSHNTCAFCSMYKEKHFSIRPLEEVLEDFRLARQTYRRVDKVFLADGDALGPQGGGVVYHPGHHTGAVSGVPAGDQLCLARFHPHPHG